MNIVEAYIKFKGQLIILVSGLSGSGKCKLARNIERDFKLKLLNLENFSKKQTDKTVKIIVGEEAKEIEVKDWDDIEIFDWDKFNDEVNKNKQNGVVICGTYFPSSKLKFESDYHMQVKIAKQKLIENRIKYIQKHISENPELEKINDEKIITGIVNKITYPHYIEYSGLSKIDKYLNANIMDENQIYDEAFSFLINSIQVYIDEYNRTKQVSSNIVGELEDDTKTKEKEKNKNQDMTFNDEYEGEYITTTNGMPPYYAPEN